MRVRSFFLIILLSLSVGEAFAGFDKLTKKNYEESKNTNAVVVYGVNWGRQWGCSKFDNAQLQSLTFSRINPEFDNLDEEKIMLSSSSRLLAKDASQSYAIIVSPGEYALTGFNIKVSNSLKEIEHIEGMRGDLFQNGKAIGGIFKADAGEIVYIGDFGLDCVNEPIPWRYYIPKEDFDSYIAGFKEKYKFLTGKQIVYRLFQTNKFGQ